MNMIKSLLIVLLEIALFKTSISYAGIEKVIEDIDNQRTIRFNGVGAPADWQSEFQKLLKIDHINIISVDNCEINDLIFSIITRRISQKLDFSELKKISFQNNNITKNARFSFEAFVEKRPYITINLNNNPIINYFELSHKIENQILIVSETRQDNVDVPIILSSPSTTNNNLSTEDPFIAWLKKEIELGSADAMYKLGQKYLGGIQVEINEQKGLQLIQDAANKDHSLAKYYLNNLSRSLIDILFFKDAQNKEKLIQDLQNTDVKKLKNTFTIIESTFKHFNVKEDKGFGQDNDEIKIKFIKVINNFLDEKYKNSNIFNMIEENIDKYSSFNDYVYFLEALQDLSLVEQQNILECVLSIIKNYKENYKKNSVFKIIETLKKINIDERKNIVDITLPLIREEQSGYLISGYIQAISDLPKDIRKDIIETITPLFYQFKNFDYQRKTNLIKLFHDVSQEELSNIQYLIRNAQNEKDIFVTFQDNLNNEKELNPSYIEELSKLKNLTEITFKDTIPEKLLLLIIKSLKELPHLTSLSFNGDHMMMRASTIESLKELPYLTSLSFNGDHMMMDTSAIKSLKELPHLTGLSFNGDHMIIRASTIESLKELPYLTSLSFNGDHMMMDTSAIKSLKELPHLTGLSFNGDHMMMDTSAIKSLKELPHLTGLSFNGDHMMMDTSAIKSLKELPHLTSLSFNGDHMMMDTSAIKSLKELPHLAGLSFNGDHMMRPMLFDNLVQLSKLENLTLKYKHILISPIEMRIFKNFNHLENIFINSEHIILKDFSEGEYSKEISKLKNVKINNYSSAKLSFQKNTIV